jgi:hypothetical protein
MRYTLFVLFLFLFNSGCKEDSSPLQSINQLTTSVNTLSDSILYTLTIPSSSFSIQDSLKGIYSVLNQAKTSRTFSSADSPIFGWTLKNDNDNSVITMAAGVSHHTTVFTLNPNKSQSFTIQHELAGILPGSYKLNAGLQRFGIQNYMTLDSVVSSLAISLQ